MPPPDLAACVTGAERRFLVVAPCRDRFGGERRPGAGRQRSRAPGAHRVDLHAGSAQAPARAAGEAQAAPSAIARSNASVARGRAQASARRTNPSTVCVRSSVGPNRAASSASSEGSVDISIGEPKLRKARVYERARSDRGWTAASRLCRAPWRSNAACLTIPEHNCAATDVECECHHLVGRPEPPPPSTLVSTATITCRASARYMARVEGEGPVDRRLRLADPSDRQEETRAVSERHAGRLTVLGAAVEASRRPPRSHRPALL